MVILKQGRKVIWHFAHKPPTDCTWARGETLAHLGAKKLVRDALVARGLRAELEYTVAALPGDRRADVMVWSPAGEMVAVELQHTSIALSEIDARAFCYSAQVSGKFGYPSLQTLYCLTQNRAGRAHDLGIAQHREPFFVLVPRDAVPYQMLPVIVGKRAEWVVLLFDVPVNAP
jgi:Competence protein CoiA-like family